MTTMREILESKGGDFRALLERLEAQTKTGITLHVLPGGVGGREADLEPPAQRSSGVRALLPIGSTVEHGGMRIHRFAPSVEVTDLANAGKRGKRVEQFSLYRESARGSDNDLDPVVNELMGARSFAQALAIAKAWAGKQGDQIGYRMQQSTARGVDVEGPAGTENAKISIETPEFSLEATQREFSVSDKRDRNNEPCIIMPSSGPKATAAKAFYQWVRAHQEEIRGMRFDALVRAVHDAGIKYHYFCAMD